MAENVKERQMVEDSEMTIDSLINEDRARSKGSAELQELKWASRLASKALREIVVNAIEAFQARNGELALQRAQIIQQLSCEYPRISEELNQEYQIPSHSRGTHGVRDIVFSYKPRDEMDDEPVCVSPQPDPSPNDRDNGGATMLDGEQAVLSDQPPSPTSKPPTTTIPMRSKDASAGRTSSTRPPRLRPLNTVKGPIKTSEIANYWVFEHRANSAYGYYIMRCPSENCPNPVFSKNPLCEGRAKRHLRQCGHKFRSVEDMIRRYALPVTTGRKKREVTEKWVRNHNSNLLASDEQHLERENLNKK